MIRCMKTQSCTHCKVSVTFVTNGTSVLAIVATMGLSSSLLAYTFSVLWMQGWRYRIVVEHSELKPRPRDTRLGVRGVGEEKSQAAVRPGLGPGAMLSLELWLAPGPAGGIPRGRTAARTRRTTRPPSLDAHRLGRRLPESLAGQSWAGRGHGLGHGRRPHPFIPPYAAYTRAGSHGDESIAGLGRGWAEAGPRRAGRSPARSAASAECRIPAVALKAVVRVES